MENHSKLLKIMVVDDNQTCLRTMSKILKKSNYEVIPFESTGDALYALQEGIKDQFDLALIEPHIGLAGFPSRLTGSKLLDYIQKSEIPIFTICAHTDKDALLESINMETSLGFTKPLTVEKMDSMRRFFLQKRAKKTLDTQYSGNFVGYGLNKMIGPSANTWEKYTDNLIGGNNVMIGTSTNPLEENTIDNFVSTNNVFGVPQYERESDPGYDSDDIGKKRMRWDPELHNKFLMALETLKEDRISPVNIQRAMDVDGITTKHVASHLQKYRRHLKEESNEAPKRCRRQTPNQISFPSPSSFVSGSSSYSSNLNLPFRQDTNLNPRIHQFHTNNSFVYKGFANPSLTKYNLMNPNGIVSTPRLALANKLINPFLIKRFPKRGQRDNMMNSYSSMGTTDSFMQTSTPINSFTQKYTGGTSMAPQVNKYNPFQKFGLMNNPNNNRLNMPKLADNNGDASWGLNWKRVEEKENKLDQNESVFFNDQNGSTNVTPNGLSLAESSGSSKEKKKSPNHDVTIKGHNTDFEAFILNEIGGKNRSVDHNPPWNMNTDDVNYCFTFDEDRIEGFESLEQLIGVKDQLGNIQYEELNNNDGGNSLGKYLEDEEILMKNAQKGDDIETGINMEKFKSNKNFMETMLN